MWEPSEYYLHKTIDGIYEPKIVLKILFSMQTRLYHSLINLIDQLHVLSHDKAVKQWQLYLCYTKSYFMLLAHKMFHAMNLRKKRALLLGIMNFISKYKSRLSYFS